MGGYRHGEGNTSDTRMNKQACKPDQCQLLGGERRCPEASARAHSPLYPLAVFSFTSFLHLRRSHGFLLSFSPPTFHLPLFCLSLSSYLELARLSQAAEQRGRAPGTTAPHPTLSSPNSGDTETSYRDPNTKRTCQPTAHLWPPAPLVSGPCAEGTRKKPQPRAAYHLLFLLFVPFQSL